VATTENSNFPPKIQNFLLFFVLVILDLSTIFGGNFKFPLVTENQKYLNFPPKINSKVKDD
jgi:hypothetical protein